MNLYTLLGQVVPPVLYDPISVGGENVDAAGHSDDVGTMRRGQA